MSVLLKSYFKQPLPLPEPVPAKVAGFLPPAKLDHGVVEGVVMPPEDDSLYEPGPLWLERAFDQAYDLVGEAEDALDCLLNNYSKKLPPHQRRKLATLHDTLAEFVKFYEGDRK